MKIRGAADRFLFVACAIATAVPLAFLLLFVLSAAGTAGGPLQSLIPSAIGSARLLLMTALLSTPLAIAMAVYFEEFRPRGRLTRAFDAIHESLMGVPSVVYGAFGLLVFVRFFELGSSLVAGALTLVALVLPTQIVVSREALRAVPDSVREGALALGATRWEAVRQAVLPVALPGLLTGVILSMARAIGETAPLLVLGLAVNAAFPVQIFYWLASGKPSFRPEAATAMLALFGLLLTVNGLAIFLRNRHYARIRL
jgi:phosphate transport system permease protein